MKDEYETKEQLITELEKTRKRIAELETRERGYKATKEELRKQKHDEGEMVKELLCIYGICDVAGGDIPLEELFQRTVDLLPPAWQYPEVTCVRLSLNDKEFRTKNFRETTWKQTSDIIVYGHHVGSVEVYYLEERPESDEGHFLKEETELITTVAEYLGKAIERKQAEQELRLKGEMITNMAEGALVVRASDNMIVHANPRLEEIFGYGPGELIGKNVSVLNDPTSGKSSEEISLEIIKVLNKCGRWSGEIQNIKKDGTCFWCRNSISTLESSQHGKVWVGVHEDITERKQAEEELKIKAQLLDDATDSIFVNDFDGNFIYLNETAYKTRGYTREEMMNLNLRGLISPQHAQLFDKRTRKIRDKGEATFEGSHLCKDGSVMQVEVHARTIKSAGKDLILTVIRDITERKQAEEELKIKAQLLDDTTDSIFVYDFDGNFIYLNEAAYKTYGYTREEMMNLGVRSLISPQHARFFEERARKVIERGETTFESGHICKDGSVMQVEVHARTIKSAGKELILTVIRDITERKQAEAQLLTYQKELRSLASQVSLAEERERRRIATELHDRVSQTMAVCRIKLGALIELAPSIHFKEQLSEINALIKHLIKEMRLLTFELSSPILYELGLEAAVEQLTDQMREQHAIQFDFEDDGQLKPLDDDIRILLFHSVRELLINVTKHAQARHAKVYIKRHDKDIRITVEDDGVGFATLEFSIDRRRTRGFGLFSIRERLQHIGGRVDIESEDGHKTCITLKAPLKQE